MFVVVLIICLVVIRVGFVCHEFFHWFFLVKLFCDTKINMFKFSGKKIAEDVLTCLAPLKVPVEAQVTGICI